SRRRHTRSKRDWSSDCALPISSENLTKPNILRYIEKELEGHEIDVKIRQRQALDYAIRVLHEQETEEHSHVVKTGDVEQVEVVRWKPKIKDKTDAAKFITSLTSVVERNRLQNLKLEKEIDKLKKELEAETSTEDKLKEYFDMLDGAFDE